MENNQTPKNIAETLARELPKPVEIASRECDHLTRVALPPNWTVKDFDDEKLLQQPRRKTASIETDTVESFVAYLTLHASEQTTVWVKADYVQGKVDFLGVVNDHGAEDDDRDWRDHRVKFAPRKSEEWNRWKAKDRQQFGQAEFAVFIEDNLADITGDEHTPSGADMLRMAIDFEAKQDMRFKSALRLQSGGVDMAFTSTDDAGTLEKMRMFDRFAIGIPVCWGADAYRVDARLRYRAKEGKVTFWYELIRADKVLEAAASKIVTTVSEGTRAPLFFGNPFAA